MGENAILTKIANSDIKIINDSALEGSISLKKYDSPKEIPAKEKSQLKNPLKLQIQH